MYTTVTPVNIQSQSQLVQEIGFFHELHQGFCRCLLVSRSSPRAKVLRKVIGTLVQEMKILLQLLLVLIESHAAAEYVHHGLSAAKVQAIWGIYMAMLKFVAVGVRCIKAKSVDHRLQLSWKVIWKSL